MTSTFTKDVELSKARAEIRRLAAALGAESAKLTIAITTLGAIKFVTQDANIHLLADQALKEIRKP